MRKIHQDKEKYFLSEAEIQDLAKYCNLDNVVKALIEEKIIKPKDTINEVQFYKPKITKENPDGYSGRIGIYEVLPITETIKEMIIKKGTASQIQEQAKKEGMRTMVEDGLIKSVQGQTSIEEVLRVIME